MRSLNFSDFDASRLLSERPVAWAETIDPFFESAAGLSLLTFLREQQERGAIIYPADPWLALRELAPDQVRVLILGQDPYHGPGQAQGRAFSVPPGFPVPPSLRNILTEVHRDLGRQAHVEGGDLSPWARQGVLLLNTVLTVEEGRPLSHAGQGWEVLIAQCVKRLARRQRPLAALLWGRPAQTHAAAFQEVGHHLVLQCNHPSPLAARRGLQPFIGSAQFSLVRDWCSAKEPHQPPLNW